MTGQQAIPAPSAGPKPDPGHRTREPCTPISTYARGSGIAYSPSRPPDERGISVSFYRVSNPAGLPVWLAYVDDELRVWCYVHNTQSFHLNQGLFEDFHITHTNRYELVSLAVAQDAIRAGLGTLDPGFNGFLIRRFSADMATLPAAEVLDMARDEAG